MVCCCSLAGTKACFSCTQYLVEIGKITMPFEPYDNSNDFKWFNSKKVTEEFKDGNLVKRIIEQIMPY